MTLTHNPTAVYIPQGQPGHFDVGSKYLHNTDHPGSCCIVQHLCGVLARFYLVWTARRNLSPDYKTIQTSRGMSFSKDFYVFIILSSVLATVLCGYMSMNCIQYF